MFDSSSGFACTLWDYLPNCPSVVCDTTHRLQEYTSSGLSNLTEYINDSMENLKGYYWSFGAASKEVLRWTLILGDPIQSCKVIGKVFFDWFCANILFILEWLANEVKEISGGEIDLSPEIYAALLSGIIGVVFAIGLTAFTDDIFKRTLKNSGYILPEDMLQNSKLFDIFRYATLGILAVLEVIAMDNIIYDIGGRFLSSEALIAARFLSFINSGLATLYVRSVFNNSDGKYKAPTQNNRFLANLIASFVGWDYSLISTSSFFITNAYGKPLAPVLGYTTLSAFVLLKDAERFVPPIKNHMALLPSPDTTQSAFKQLISWIGSFATIGLSTIGSYIVTKNIIEKIFLNSNYYAPASVILYAILILETPGEFMLQIAGGFPQMLEKPNDDEEHILYMDDFEIEVEEGYTENPYLKDDKKENVETLLSNAF